MKTAVLPQTQVIELLYRALGSQRAWADFLADCIRHRADFHGLVLLPICRIHEKCLRPYYSPADVKQFIHAASMKSPRPTQISRKIVELDPLDKRHWKLKTLKPINR